MNPDDRESLIVEVRDTAAKAHTRARLLLPVFVVLAVLCFASALLLGVANEWKLDAWVDGGLKSDAPLWVPLAVLPTAGVLLTVWGIANLRSKRRELTDAVGRVAHHSE